MLGPNLKHSGACFYPALGACFHCIDARCARHTNPRDPVHDARGQLGLKNWALRTAWALRSKRTVAAVDSSSGTVIRAQCRRPSATS